LYKDLEENGAKSLYKLAKTRKRRSLDLDRMKFVKNSEGKILSEGEEIKERWRQYFSLLINTKNKRKELEEADKIEGPISHITREEVKKQLEKMKNGKAAGPDEFSMEIVKKLGDLGLDCITAVLREVQDERIPEEWRRSKITPIYKQKGDPWTAVITEGSNC